MVKYTIVIALLMGLWQNKFSFVPVFVISSADIVPVGCVTEMLTTPLCSTKTMQSRNKTIVYNYNKIVIPSQRRN